jgi:hypothetical protein
MTVGARLNGRFARRGNLTIPANRLDKVGYTGLGRYALLSIRAWGGTKVNGAGAAGAVRCEHAGGKQLDRPPAWMGGRHGRSHAR